MALEQVGGTEARSGISRLTTEYIYWPILSGDGLDGTNTSIGFAAGQGEPTIWNPAEVVPNPDDPAQNVIRLLVGPDGGVDLSPDEGQSKTHRVWVKINFGAESIVRFIGTLVVR